MVPLDGTAFAAAILPDARRLAGQDGVLILLNQFILAPCSDEARQHEAGTAVQASREYLREIADDLRAENVKVEMETVGVDDLVRGIDDAPVMLHADTIAITTHAAEVEKLPRDSIAWRALAQSPVPVLIRHISDAGGAPISPEPHERRIMVPLDGSALAEKALPLARELATEWTASLWLVHVVSHYPITDFARTETDPDAITDDVALRSGQQYLERIAEELGHRVQTRVLMGSPVDELVTAAGTWSISDVILSSHGRTGMARAMLGSVADSLLRRLDLPMIVVPARASEAVGPHHAGRRKEDMHDQTTHRQ